MEKDGPSKGRDGNSHFGVVDKGTLMVVSPLPDSAPVAVGWALASQQQGSGVVAVANCGEGATATGTWHESVNMAGVLNLPVFLQFKITNLLTLHRMRLNLELQMLLIEEQDTVFHL